MKISFFGSSLVSAYWNGAATYYRGIIRALSRRGHTVTFYEPDAYDRQRHRDIDDPPWARVVVYPPTEEGVLDALKAAHGSDIVAKASGVGVFDEFLEGAVLDLRCGGSRVLFWDVDAPATLDRLSLNPDDPFWKCLPEYDLVLTYGGGPPVKARYEEFGARRCVSVYNAVDPDTHHPVPPDVRFACDLALMANRLPDREARIAEFFLEPARRMPNRNFLLAGNGWVSSEMPPNVQSLGHLFTRDHNAFNSSPLALLSVNRESMARFGYSPGTRIFEAAGAGACIIGDAWEGAELFLEPDEEWLLASNGEDVAAHLDVLSPDRAWRIGERARRRVLAQHTYTHRAEQVESILVEKAAA